MNFTFLGVRNFSGFVGTHYEGFGNLRGRSGSNPETWATSRARAQDARALCAGARTVRALTVLGPRVVRACADSPRAGARTLAGAYFAFLEILCSCHLTFILNLDTSTFIYIVGSLDLGLKGLNESISSQCASALDHLASFYFFNVTMGDSPTSPAALNLAQRVTDCPGLFPQLNVEAQLAYHLICINDFNNLLLFGIESRNSQNLEDIEGDILKTLFEIIIFEDCGNRWSLSRPMLSLILINEEMFTSIKGQILASFPLDQQQRLSPCFDKLMADVTRSLEQNNRDRFTQNLNRFKNGLRVV
ncbi:hypothetical protein L484_027925 [Morus notabilis]|uniref:Exportin-7 n=1 Tax=Morus notabilis TaxID=981085 RepID=W9S7G6_9ROSA|nr:hypothetical protein L484_027925 [Morus notabilis]